MSLTKLKKKCERPTCTAVSTKTYRGEHGNTLRLCERCYYNLVKQSSLQYSGSSTPESPLTFSQMTQIGGV